MSAEDSERGRGIYAQCAGVPVFARMSKASVFLTQELSHSGIQGQVALGFRLSRGQGWDVSLEQRDESFQTAQGEFETVINTYMEYRMRPRP